MTLRHKATHYTKHVALFRSINVLKAKSMNPKTGQFAVMTIW